MARLDLEALSKVFPGDRASPGDVVAVRELSLIVAAGEFLVLVGPSGCGKTTTLRLVAGLTGPTSGVVRIDGRDVAGLSPATRDVAMVFPRGALYPHLTAYENLAWGLRLRRGGGWLGRIGRLMKRLRHPVDARQRAAGEADLDEQVRGVAEQLGLNSLLHRLPSQLSDGQRQRVALGRAMVRRPAVYLMDEPLTGLDGPLRSQLRQELKAWHRTSGATVLYVTHDQTEALMLGDRVAVMNEGELQQIGSPQEVYEKPKNRFVAGFVGNPPMNLIEGDLFDAGGLTFRAAGWSVPLPRGWQDALRAQAGQRVTLGVRPEHLTAWSGQPIEEGRHEQGDREEEDRNGQNEQSSLVVRGMVSVVERAGDLSVAYVRPTAASEGARSIAAPEAGAESKGSCLAVKKMAADVRPGDVVRVTVDPARMHLFDSASGDKLGLPQIE
jgi:multiple sugar transport system ATP-binding protein